MSASLQATGTVEGLDVLLRKLEHPTWFWESIRDLFEVWTGDVERGWKENIHGRSGESWYWKGGSEASIEHLIDRAGHPMWAAVGTNEMKLRWGEYGTGLLSEDPDSAHQRHFPPPMALEEWALDHGFPNGYVVAKIIADRGGLEPRHLLRDAARDVWTGFPPTLAATARQIERRAGSGS